MTNIEWRYFRYNEQVELKHFLKQGEHVGVYSLDKFLTRRLLNEWNYYATIVASNEQLLHEAGQSLGRTAKFWKPLGRGYQSKPIELWAKYLVSGLSLNLALINCLNLRWNEAYVENKYPSQEAIYRETLRLKRQNVTQTVGLSRFNRRMN